MDKWSIYFCLNIDFLFCMVENIMDMSYEDREVLFVCVGLFISVEKVDLGG